AYRPADAAKALGISRSKLYELLQRGELPAKKVGSATLIRRVDLEAWLAAQPEVQ
ncbi:MAG: helix-turn-helix domain-containing protein, partial [Chloroflexi bacterium]|nr:helix-turn-helix domain-containing protein [Chloroflexota bacterium]